MNPVEVVCAVIERDGRIFLARRPPGKLLGGLWEFPGGKIEQGESAHEALHRELAEELGCRVHIHEALPPFEHAYPWCVIRLHAFRCTLKADSPEPMPLEHSELIWVPNAELQTRELAPADLPVVQMMQ
jgi:8-oxo-dGTP diphosphatase